MSIKVNTLPADTDKPCNCCGRTKQGHRASGTKGRRAMQYSQLTGRCASGSQLGAGMLWHAVDTEDRFPNFAPAICGARPGRRSAGWSDLTSDHATCSKCLKKLERSKALGQAAKAAQAK